MLHKRTCVQPLARLAPSCHHTSLSQDRLLHVSHFASVSEKTGFRHYQVSWQDLCQALSQHNRRESKEGALYNLGYFDGRRLKEKTLALSGIILDFEHIDGREARAILDLLAPLAYQVHSTFRSRHQEPPDRTNIVVKGKKSIWQGEIRMHVTVPFARDVTLEEYERLWLILFRWFPQNDVQTKDGTHFYYLPSSPETFTNAQGESSTAVPFSLAHDGQFLDVDALLRDFQGAPPVAVMSQAEPSPVEALKVSDTAFTRVVKKLARGTGATAAAFEALAKGLAFAEPGNRDRMLFLMVNDLAKALPQADPESIAAHFSASLSLMSLQDPEGALTSEQVAYKFARAREKVLSDPESIDLVRSSSGVPKPGTENIKRVLEHDSALAGRFKLNLFSERIHVFCPPWAPEISRELSESDLTEFRSYLERTYFLFVKPGDVHSALEAHSRKQGWHPVRDYLESVTWDRVPRLEQWLQTHFGVRDSEYTRKVGSWWLQQAVARVFEPGCQADYTLILQGAQGLRKSRSLAALASREWFSDDIRDIGERSAAEQLSGKWIIELAELASVRRADNEKVKGWLTRSVDRYRVPYGRLAQDFARQCVTCGSTNEHEFLPDSTGNRRYWVVEVSGEIVDAQALLDERDQLWAEAVARYKAGERRWPDTSEEHRLFAEALDRCRVVDDFETAVRQWCLKPWGWNNEPLSTRRLIEMLVGDSNPRPQDSTRMNNALFACGWTRAGGGVRLWIPPEGIAGVTKAPVESIEDALSRRKVSN